MRPLLSRLTQRYHLIFYSQELKPGFDPELFFVLLLLAAVIQESGSDFSASLSKASPSVLGLFCLPLESESRPESLPGS